MEQKGKRMNKKALILANTIKDKIQSYNKETNFVLSDYYDRIDEYLFALICCFNDNKMFIIEFYFDTETIEKYFYDIYENFCWIGEEIKNKKNISDVRMGAIKEILSTAFEEGQYKLKI